VTTRADDQPHAGVVRCPLRSGRRCPRQHAAPEQCSCPNRQVDEEHETPPAGGDENGAEGRPGRHGQCAHTSPQRHDLRAALDGEGGQQQPQGGRQHGGGTGALDDASGDEQAEGRGNTTQGRAEAEHEEAHEEHPLATETVSGTAGRHEERAEDDAVAGDHPDERGARVEREGTLQSREGDVHDGQVERRHEGAERRDREHNGAASARRRRLERAAGAGWACAGWAGAGWAGAGWAGAGWAGAGWAGARRAGAGWAGAGWAGAGWAGAQPAGFCHAMHSSDLRCMMQLT